MAIPEIAEVYRITSNVDGGNFESANLNLLDQFFIFFTKCREKMILTEFLYFSVRFVIKFLKFNYFFSPLF